MIGKSPCLEVAISMPKEPDAFEKLQIQAHRDLESFPGFVSDISLREIENGSIRADLILWEMEAFAIAAAEAIQQDERFSGFMQSIESVLHFAHYNGASAKAVNNLGRSPVIEISVWQTPLESSNAAKWRTQLHETLKAEGASLDVAGVNIKNSSTLLNLAGWKDKSAHDATLDALLKSPELQDFFSSIEEVEFQALFEVVK